MLTRLRPSPALIVAMAALVMAMSGAAIALPGKGTVQTNDLKNGAVTKKKIARGAVGSAQIIGKSIKGNRLKDAAVTKKQLRDGAVTEKKLEDQAVTAAKVKDGTLTGKQVAAEGVSSANISDYAVIGTPAGGPVKLTATDGASADAARTAAPATQLLKKGQLTISAKCFTDTSVVGGQTFAEIYIETSADGAIFDGSTDELSGGNAAADFLNVATLATDRVLDDVSATGPTAAMDEGEFNAVSADGATHLIGQTTVAAKNGALAGGNGVYGAGNVCLFGGEVAG